MMQEDAHPMAPSPKVNAGLPAHELDTLVTKWKHQGYRQDIRSEDDNAEPLESVTVGVTMWRGRVIWICYLHI